MESRAFIRVAAEVIDRIGEAHNTIGTSEELRSQREAIQKEVSQLFVGLQNPTLPSAYRLRDVALRNGYFVDPKVQYRLTQFEFITG